MPVAAEPLQDIEPVQQSPQRGVVSAGLVGAADRFQLLRDDVEADTLDDVAAAVALVVGLVVDLGPFGEGRLLGRVPPPGFHLLALDQLRVGRRSNHADGQQDPDSNRSHGPEPSELPIRRLVDAWRRPRGAMDRDLRPCPQVVHAQPPDRR